MTKVYVKYNPYKLKTDINVNGREVTEDSVIYKILRGKRLQEWIVEFPTMLVDEFNSVSFEIDFCGMPLDWDDFAEALSDARELGVFKDSTQSKIG